MTEIVTVAGLDEQRLNWVADLYGNADPKYLDRPFLEHLFLRNPVGPSLHAFAVDGDRPVGHCCVVRTNARLGHAELPAGKLEALWIEGSHRKQRGPDGATLVRTLLTRLYAFSDANGVQLVHALATPRIGRVIAFTPLRPVGERSLVGVATGSSIAASALGLFQRALREAGAAPLGPVSVRPATDADADLADVPVPADGRWTIVAGDAWHWYRASPLIRVLELESSRALVQLPASPHESLRVVGWRSERPGLRAGLRLLAAAGRLARSKGASTLRFQPWDGPSGDGPLGRACRLAGLVPRDDLTTVWVHSPDSELVRPEAAVSTPFLYLGF
jgi:hypothetical protein